MTYVKFVASLALLVVLQHISLSVACKAPPVTMYYGGKYMAYATMLQKMLQYDFHNSPCNIKPIRVMNTKEYYDIRNQNA